MSKQRKEDRKEAAASEPSLTERLVAGDNAGARAEARRILADPASTEESKAAARDTLRRTGFDRPALALAIVGLIVVLTVAALLLLP